MIWYETSSGPNKISVEQYQFFPKVVFFYWFNQETAVIECSPARQEARVEIPDIIGALSGLQIFFCENSGWIYGSWQHRFKLKKQQKNGKKNSIEKQFEIRNTLNAKFLLHTWISFLENGGRNVNMPLCQSQRTVVKVIFMTLYNSGTDLIYILYLRRMFTSVYKLCHISYKAVLPRQNSRLINQITQDYLL